MFVVMRMPMLMLVILIMVGGGSPSPVEKSSPPSSSGGQQVIVSPMAINTQYHAQDSRGHYKYGYSNGDSSKEESRSVDGVTRGSYSYVDPNGHLQTMTYEADAVRGFRVSSPNSRPVPSVPIADHSVELARISSSKTPQKAEMSENVPQNEENNESIHQWSYSIAEEAPTTQDRHGLFLVPYYNTAQQPLMFLWPTFPLYTSK